MDPLRLVLTLLTLPMVLLALGCANPSGERIAPSEPIEEHVQPQEKPTTTGTNTASPVAEAMSGETIVSEAATPTDDSSTPPPDVEDTPPPSSIAVHSDALVVNNETISVSDILEPLQPTMEKLVRELPPRAYYERVSEMVRRQIIEAVAQHLIWRKAKAKINDDMQPQIDKTLDKIEKERITREFGGSEARYEKYLTKYNKTHAEVRERLRRSVIIDSYLRDHLLPLVGTPRKPDLQQYYEAHRDEFSRPSRRELYLIEVPIATFLDRRRPVTEIDLAEARRLARKEVEDAASAIQGGMSFEDAARKYSRGVNKEIGGGWGFIGEPLQGRWATPSKRLFQMDAGQISDIIEADDCYFLVKAGQVETGGETSFQDAQPQIIEAWRQERFMRLRADFLQKELNQSSIGSLDAFVREVLRSVPQPAAE